MHVTGLRRVAAALLLGALLALPLACVNPFRPSDPQPPDGSGVAQNFQSPDSVLATLQRAIEAKSIQGAEAYIACFTDSTVPADRAFRAFYDPSVRLIWQAGGVDAPEPWNRSSESRVPNRLYLQRQNASYNWQWSRDPFAINDEEAADTAQFHRKYVLLATDPQSSTSEIISIGYTDLSFLRKEGRWSIVRWNDRVDPTVGANPSNDQRTMTWWRLKSLER